METKVEICGVIVAVGKHHISVRQGKTRRTYWIYGDTVTTNVVKIAGSEMDFPHFASKGQPWD